MSEYFKGTVLASAVVNSSSGDTYGTHHSNLGVGGYVEVNTLVQRDAIPVDAIFPTMYFDGISSGRRRLGMLVHVLETNTIYRLFPKVSNVDISYSTWVGYSNTQKYTALSNNLNWSILFSFGSGSTFNGESIQKTYTQANHGFVKGDVIGFNGTSFIKVSSITAFTIEPIGVVSVSDSTGLNRNFTITIVGNMNTSGIVDYSGGTLINGKVYYLATSSYPGKLTKYNPNNLTDISKPMLLKSSGTTGIVLQYRGLTNADDGVSVGIFNGYTGNTQTVYLNNIVTGGTNIGYFSGRTGVQTLDILTAEPQFNGIYRSVYNYYYRDTSGIIRIGSPTRNGLLRRGYVSDFTPKRSWIYNTRVNLGEKVGWTLVNGDITENVGTFLSSISNMGSPLLTQVDWWYNGGLLGDGYYSNNAISLQVTGNLYTGTTYSGGGPVYSDKKYSELRFRTLMSKTPETLAITYDDGFVWFSGGTDNSSGTTNVTGFTGVTNLGTGYGVYDSVTNYNVKFKSLIGSGATTITQTTGGTLIIGSGELINLVSGATNGVKLVNREVKLGGDLIENTNINLKCNDISFNHSGFINGGFNTHVNIISIDNYDKILIGGSFNTYSGITNNFLIRLNSDGTIDNTFIVGSVDNAYYVNTIKTQTNDKIIVGGYFDGYSGVTSGGIFRLNSDGTYDNSFNTGGGFNYLVNSIVLQLDEKILVGGGFVDYSGQTCNRIVRLNSNGSIDTTFDSGSGFNNSVLNITLLADDKILVGGNFTSYSGQTCNRIVRLNSDGSIDTTFDSGSGFNGRVRSILLVNNECVLVGGDFTSYSGQTCNHIVRLNSDGSIDTTFDSGSGFNNIVNTFSVLACERILVGGNFTTYNAVVNNRVASLNFNGTNDIDTDVITINSNGGVFGADYSYKYVNRSIPDVAYVTGITSTLMNSTKFNTTYITSDITLNDSDTFIILVNSSTPITITLPLSPSNNRVFKIKDVSGNAQTYNVTINGNSRNIDGYSDGTIDTDYGSFELIYNQDLDQWYTLSIM